MHSCGLSPVRFHHSPTSAGPSVPPERATQGRSGRHSTIASAADSAPPRGPRQRAIGPITIYPWRAKATLRDATTSPRAWYPGRYRLWPVPDDRGQPVHKLRPAAVVVMILANLLIVAIVVAAIWYFASR
jgi:hypothetical protein